MAQDIAALRAEVARLTADKAQTIAEFDQAIRDGRITVHIESWKSRAEQAEAENAKLKAINRLQQNQLDASPFCPDCRDKVRHQPCPRCRYQAAESSRQADRDTLRQQIEALPRLILGRSRDDGHGPDDVYVLFDDVWALLGERREEPTQK